VLAIDAHKTLLIDRDPLIEFANQQKICVIAMDPSRD
jgi:DUF1009 family protein